MKTFKYWIFPTMVALILAAFVVLSTATVYGS